MPTRVIAFVAKAALLTIAACAPRDSNPEDQGDVITFVNACLGSSNLTRPICECAGRKAKAELSPDGFAFLTATLEKDEARAEELRGRLDPKNIIAAGTFMLHGPADCAREQAGVAKP